MRGHGSVYCRHNNPDREPTPDLEGAGGGSGVPTEGRRWRILRITAGFRMNETSRIVPPQEQRSGSIWNTLAISRADWRRRSRYEGVRASGWSSCSSLP